MFYIFTDVDGVLNNDETQDRVENDYLGISPELVDNFKELYDTLVERYGEVKIILSSTWKHRWYKTQKSRQDEFANRLDEALAAVGLEVSDKIGESYFTDRGALIKEYIEACPCDDFVILDDCWFDFIEEGLMDHIIHTNESYGLRQFDIDLYFRKREVGYSYYDDYKTYKPYKI